MTLKNDLMYQEILRLHNERLRKIKQQRMKDKGNTMVKKTEFENESGTCKGI